MRRRILYAKGGRAVEEAGRLFPRSGELPDGGPDKFLLAVLFHLRGAPFRLVSLGPRSVRTRIGAHEVAEYGAHPASPLKIVRRFAFFPSGIRFFLGTLAFRPSTVLCGLDGPFGLFAWTASFLGRSDFVFLAHGALDLSSSARLYRWANRFLCRRARWVVAHGPFVHAEAIAIGAAAERVLEFNNGLDAEHAAIIDRLPAKVPGSATILYLGRMEAEKGVFDLLKAFLALPDALGLKLDFIGQGGAIAPLQAAIDAGGHGDRIRIIGAVPFDGIFAHLRNAAVVATPTQSRFPEGFCKAAMEAFFVGTPVVAPDYGPFPHMVEHERNGLLYKTDSVAGLQAALLRFFTDSRLRRSLEQGAGRSGQDMARPRLSFGAAMARVLA